MARVYHGNIENDKLRFKVFMRQREISLSEISVISFQNIDSITFECVYIVVFLQDGCCVKFSELDVDLIQVEKLLKQKLSFLNGASIDDFTAESDAGDSMAVFDVS